MIIKIHESYRKIVAVCDSELLGKKFEEGIKQLDIREDFYGNDERDEQEIVQILQDALSDDATFNFVGKKAVEAGIKAGIISKGSILTISGVPYILSLI